eukprot:scaffold19363_cov67-Phaeocystis_antarctica.AAC.5
MPCPPGGLRGSRASGASGGSRGSGGSGRVGHLEGLPRTEAVGYLDSDPDSVWGAHDDLLAGDHAHGHVHPQHSCRLRRLRSGHAGRECHHNRRAVCGSHDVLAARGHSWRYLGLQGRRRFFWRRDGGCGSNICHAGRRLQGRVLPGAPVLAAHVLARLHRERRRRLAAAALRTAATGPRAQAVMPVASRAQSSLLAHRR